MLVADQPSHTVSYNVENMILQLSEMLVGCTIIKLRNLAIINARM